MIEMKPSIRVQCQQVWTQQWIRKNVKRDHPCFPHSLPVSHEIGLCFPGSLWFCFSLFSLNLPLVWPVSISSFHQFLSIPSWCVSFFLFFFFFLYYQGNIFFLGNSASTLSPLAYSFSGCRKQGPQRIFRSQSAFCPVACRALDIVPPRLSSYYHCEESSYQASWHMREGCSERQSFPRNHTVHQR